MKGEEADRVRKNALGLGLLLGGAVFSYGRSCGCKKAEILAINDDGEDQDCSPHVVRNLYLCDCCCTQGVV
jgi:hypothetical protein